MPVIALVILTVALALVFDFLNGFHDSANSIATIVSTRVLTPLQAVAWAAFFNFVSAFTFGTSVAATVGKGFVDTHIVTIYVVLAGVLGANVWDLVTWWLALPTSSSHAIIGGYAGAAIARGVFEHGFLGGFGALILGKWPLTLAFIVLAPLIGLVAAFVMMIAVYWLFQKSTPVHMVKVFRNARESYGDAIRFIAVQPCFAYGNTCSGPSAQCSGPSGKPTKPSNGALHIDLILNRQVGYWRPKINGDRIDEAALVGIGSNPLVLASRKSRGRSDGVGRSSKINLQLRCAHKRDYGK